MEDAQRWVFGLCALKPAEWDALSPAEVELVIAGARWREERENDRAVLIRLAIAGGHARDHLGGKRELGESLIPGYRKGDARRG